jgi:hypothetical protein
MTCDNQEYETDMRDVYSKNEKGLDNYGFKSVKNTSIRYTPWRSLWGEQMQLLLMLDLGTKWDGRSVTPRPLFNPWQKDLQYT